MPHHLTKKSFTLSGHRTSVALEPAFWSALATMADARRHSLARLVEQIDAARAPHHPLASMLRISALSHASGTR